MPHELRPHPDTRTKLGWWSISGEDLLEMLRKVQAGADPSMVYAEHYANCDREEC